MIAHIDADAFFASVLQRMNPRLKGKPLLALGMGGSCVIAASYEAKAKGVRTGMRLTDALALCPDALRLPSDFQETGLASQQIEAILRQVCPLIEQYSIDEWFLDLASVPGGVPENLQRWASGLQRHILDTTALSVSIGIGPSKLLAKMASEYRKPAGITVVANETSDAYGPFLLDIQTFLSDRPAAAVPGIGHRRSTHTDANGWKTAWDIANADRDAFVKICGKPGADMQRELLGEQISAVSIEAAPPKSVSRGRSFRRTCAPRILWAYLLRHLEYTVLKMRRHNLTCQGISVWLRDDQYHHESVHISLPQPGNTEETLQPYVQRAFEQLCQPQRFYTSTGLALWRLTPRAARQFSLFEEPAEALEEDRVQETLDTLHKRFGRKSITKASALAVETGTKTGLMGLPMLE